MTINLRHIVTGLISVSVAFSVQAATLESHGRPDPKIDLMSSYGVNVATRQGLRTVIPAGWQLFVHKSVELPSVMSWKVGDPWTKVLSDFAANNSIAVLLDWEKKTVLLRSSEVAQEESSRRHEISREATTPLPRFASGDPSALQQEQAHAQLQSQITRDTGPQQAVTPSLAHLPVIPTTPPASPPTAPQSAVPGVPVQDVGKGGEFSYTSAMSSNRPSARAVAQGIANKFNYRLVWAAPEFNLQGPVTLLAEDPEQDVKLLQNAIGKLGPVALEVSTAERVIRALPREAALASLDTRQKLLDAAEEKYAPREIGIVGAFIKPKLILQVGEREPLEDALVRFTRAHGYTLEWKVEGGFEANRNMTFEGGSVAEVLTEVLPTLGLSADIYTRDNHIVVRPGNAATDR